MPLRLRLRTRASRDLLDIVDYIAERNRDDLVALQFGQRLLARCRELTRAPGAGAPRRGLHGLRKVVEGPYKIYYQVASKEVVILRIWDGRRGSEPPLPR